MEITGAGLAPLPKQELEKLNVFVERGLALKEEAEKLVIANSSDVVAANGIFKQTQLAEKSIEDQRKVLVAPFNDFVKQVNTLAKEVAQPTQQAKLIVQEKLLAYNKKIEDERRAKAEEEKKQLEAKRLQEEKERQEREAVEQKKREAEEARFKAIEIEQRAAAAQIEREQDVLKKRQLEIDAENLKKEKELEGQRIANEQAKRKLEEDQKEIDRQKAEMEEAERKKKEKEAQDAIDKANKVKGVRNGYKFTVVDEAKVPRQYCSPDDKKIREAIKQGVLTIDGLLIEEDKRIQ